MCNINEGKLGVDKFAHTHTHTHTHTRANKQGLVYSSSQCSERRELLSKASNRCFDFNSLQLFKNGGDWLNRVSHLLMKRGVI